MKRSSRVLRGAIWALARAINRDDKVDIYPHEARAVLQELERLRDIEVEHGRCPDSSGLIHVPIHQEPTKPLRSRPLRKTKGTWLVKVVNVPGGTYAFQAARKPRKAKR